MDFPPSLNFLSLRERLHDAWLLLWPLLFLLGEEDPVLSSDRGLVEDDDDDKDEREGEGDGIFCFFFLLESPLLLLESLQGEGKGILLFLRGVRLLFSRLRLGTTSLSKEEEVSFPPLFFMESL